MNIKIIASIAIVLSIGLQKTSACICTSTESNKKSEVCKTSETEKTYGNIASLLEKSAKNDIVTLELNDVIITNFDNNDIYIRDNTGAIALRNSYDNIFKTLKDSGKNYILNGKVRGKVVKFLSTTPVLSIQSNSDVSDVVATENPNEVLPIEVSLDDIGKHISDLVTVKNVTVTNKNTNKDQSNKLILNNIYYVYNSNFSSFDPTKDNPYNGAKIDITGIVYSSKTIAPRTRNDITYIVDEEAENVIETTNYNISYKNNLKIRLKRSFSNKYWNTICLPCSLTVTQVKKIFGENTVLAKYDKAENGVISFVKTEVLFAGKGYLILPEHTVENPVISGVGFNSKNPTPISGNNCFYGTYNPVELKTDKTEFFFSKSGTLSYPAAGKNKLKGLRAYFKYATTVDNAKDIMINIDGITSGIEVVDGENVSERVRVYNLNGQYLGNSTENLEKGIYIVNKKKVIIK